MPGTHYHLMGLPVWCTKAEVVARYGELRRLRTSHGAVPMEALEEAFAVLGDVDKRAKYDAELGLQSRRRSRIDLRPLGLFSKSLSRAQQAWPTWERELLAVLITLLHLKRSYNVRRPISTLITSITR